MAGLVAAGPAFSQSMPPGMPADHSMGQGMVQGGTSHLGVGHAMGRNTNPAAAVTTDGRKGYDDAMAASMAPMHAMMSAKPTGMPDRDFVAMMLPHHQGAVAMAKVQLRYGRDPALRRLARSIVKDQEREIAFMKAWQARHAKP